MAENAPPVNNRLKISTKELRCRVRDHVYTMYLNYAFFIKGAVVAIAGLSFLGIVAVPGVEFVREKISLWVASFFYSLVTIATWSRGSVFTNSRANVLDVICPISLGMLEVLLYLVLGNSTLVPGLPPDGWIIWYLIYALFALAAFFLVLNRLAQAKPTDYSDEELIVALVDNYRRWLRADMIGSAISFVAGFEMYVACLYWPFLRTADAVCYHVAAASMLTVVALGILYRSTQQLQELASA